MSTSLRPAPSQPSSVSTRAPFVQRILGRRGAALVLVLSVLVVGVASALLGSAEAPPRGEAYPASAESAVVAEQLEGFPGSDTAPVLLVATKGDDARLTSADERAAIRVIGPVPDVDPDQPPVCAE